MSQRAIGEARKGLINAGFGADLSAAASEPGDLFGGGPETELEHLAEIAAYIGESDQHMIGAVFLLELEGYERAHLQLELPQGAVQS